MMQEAVGDEQTNWNLTARMLAVNFGAVHTSAMVGTAHTWLRDPST